MVLELKRLPVLILLASAAGAFAENVSSAIVIADDSGACVMLGHYVRGGFRPATELSSSRPDPYPLAARAILQTLRIGDTLVGIDSQNRQTRALVKAVNNTPDLGESSVDLGTTGWREGVVALLSNPQLPIRLIRPKRVRLPKEIDVRLRREIDVLFRKHLPERAPDERPSGLEVRGAIVETLKEAPGLLFVKYPLVLIEKDGVRDDRAQAFFLFSVADTRIVRAVFGHGEWAITSSVLTIWPEMYFRVGKADQIYFVGLHRGGWEDASGRALYDLRTGRELLLCY